MKVTVKHWHAIAQWRWDTGSSDADDDGEGDVCGICRVPYEGCCPSCKMPGDDCPLSLYAFYSLCFFSLKYFTCHSLGRMQPCVPYALPAPMDRHSGIQATMPNGQETMGCVSVLSPVGRLLQLIIYV
ncbi:hypothetical protein AcW1_000193 [Taiwanofungus camphoratus]|nr:hypothetical protein AcW1_000193 [Antrodia cinnamomea]